MTGKELCPLPGICPSSSGPNGKEEKSSKTVSFYLFYEIEESRSYSLKSEVHGMTSES
jgi:hypothetical protein